MPSKEWAIRGASNAYLGLDVSQSGRYLYVTISRKRNNGATFYDTSNGNASVTVSVNGGSSQGGVSASNAFPTSLTVGTWYSAALVNAQFDLGYGVSTANVTVTWSYPTSSWASGSTAYSFSVTPFYDAPAAPTSVTATRVSDTSATLAWTRHATTDAPYASQEVYRSENGGSLIDTAPLSGTATGYTVATVANRKYTFTIQARNSAGSTNSSASSTLLTTPAKLASLTGTKVSTGIKLTLSKLDVPYSEAQVVVEVTTDAGSSWSAVHTFAATDLSTTAATDWIDTGAPTSGTAQYRATVETTGGTQGVLSSAVTLSNALTLNTPPLAPTNLTPSGLVDVASPVTLAWEHTASSDGAAQSSRQIQYSTDSGASQTDIVTGNSTAESYDWTVDTGDFTAGDTIQWRVRTAGSQPGTYGAWSAWQTITLRQSLSVSITSPTDTWEGGDIPVEWTATPGWGSASQVAYRITMSSTAGVAYDSGTIVSDTLGGSIPASAQTNLTEYTITVTVTDNYGLTSLPESTVIDTDFLAPGPVGLTWEYDDNLGQLVLTPEFSAETSSDLDDTDSWGLERSLDNSEWTLIDVWSGDDPVPDSLVRVGAESFYRTTGYTALGVAGEQTVFTVPASDVKSKWGRLNYGDGFGNAVRFGWSQTKEIASGRASDAYEVEGSEYPLAVFGEPLFQKISVTGKLLYKRSPGSGGIPDDLTTATDLDMDVMAKTAGVCLYRDASGRYWPCRVTDVKVVVQRALTGQPDAAAVTFTVERLEG